MAAKKLLQPCGWGETEFPCGFRFNPTEEELVRYYLQRKVDNALPDNAMVRTIKDPDSLYNDDPWNIFDKELCGYFYIFTKLKVKSKAKIERKAGSGTWKGQSSKKIRDSQGNVIYVKKDFVFEENKKRQPYSSCSSKENENGHWIMWEFSLKNEGFDGNYVLCRIWNKYATREETGDPEVTALVLPCILEKKKRKSSSTNDDQNPKKMLISPCNVSRENNLMVNENELALVSQPEQRNYSGSQFLMTEQASSFPPLLEYGHESEYALVSQPEQMNYSTAISGSQFLMTEQASSSPALLEHGHELEFSLVSQLEQRTTILMTEKASSSPELLEHGHESKFSPEEINSSTSLFPSDDDLLCFTDFPLPSNLMAGQAFPTPEYGVSVSAAAEVNYNSSVVSPSDLNNNNFTSLFSDLDAETIASIEAALDKFLVPLQDSFIMPTTTGSSSLPPLPSIEK